jgi:hypothetical protein
MKKIIAIVAIVLISSGIASAQDLKTYKATYEKSIENIMLSHGMKMTDLGQNYSNALDALLTKVKKAGDLDKCTAVMEEIARFRVEKGMPKQPSASLGIKKLQSAFAKQASSHEAGKAKDIISLTGKYDKALERLQKSLVSSDKFDDARATQAERKSVQETDVYKNAKAILVPHTSISTKVTPEKPFDWEKRRKNFSYSYTMRVSSQNTKGVFAYDDSECKKLLDGVVKTKWGAHSVGWLKMTPPAIVLRFRQPVQPKSMRIHVFGKESGGSVSVTREVRLYAGSKLKQGDLIGNRADLPNKTGWIDVPIEMSKPSTSFVLELDKSDLSWVMIDEIEFK